MAEVLRFTTLRIGVATITMGEQAVEVDLRVLRASDGSYRWLADSLSEPLPSVDAAAQRAEESMPGAAGVVAVVRWRADVTALTAGEHACPVCAAPASGSPRHPRRLCPACVMEATDAQGRPLRFGNTGLSGGFEARYADDGALRDDHECFVRGIRCRADESKFGGIVVQPIAP